MLTERDLDKLRYICIRFPKNEEDDGVNILLSSGQPVFSFRKGEYRITPTQRRLLDERKIRYSQISA